MSTANARPQGNGQHVEDDRETALDQAIRDMREALAEEPEARPRRDSTLGEGAPDREFLLGIPVTIEAVLGALTMPMAEIMALKQGSRINLQRRLGEPIDLTANGSRIARGELTVLDTDPPSFGIVLTEVAGV